MSLLRDICLYFVASTKVDQSDTFAIRKKFSFLPMLAAPADFQAELGAQGNQTAVHLYYSSTPCEDGSQEVSKCNNEFGESTDFGAGTDTILISQFTQKEYALFQMNNQDYANACKGTGGEAAYKARIYANMKQRMYQAIEGIEKEAGLWVHNNAGYHNDGTHSYVGANPLNATTKNLKLTDETGRPIATSLIHLRSEDIQNGFEGMDYKWVGDVADVQAAAQYDTDFNANTSQNGTSFVAEFLRKVFYSAYTKLFGEVGRGKIYKVAPGATAVLYYSGLTQMISMPTLSGAGDVATDEFAAQRIDEIIAQVAMSEDNLGDSTAAIQKTFVWRDPQTGALLDFIFTYKKCDGRWDIKGVMRITYHFWKNPKAIACSLVNGIEAYGVCNPVQEVVCPVIVPIQETQKCVTLGNISGCGVVKLGDQIDISGIIYTSPISMNIANVQDLVMFLSLLGIGAFSQNCGAFIYTPAYGQVLLDVFSVKTEGDCSSTFEVSIAVCAPCEQCLTQECFATNITATRGVDGNGEFLEITPTFALSGGLTIVSYDWSGSVPSAGQTLGATNAPTLKMTNLAAGGGSLTYQLIINLSNGATLELNGFVSINNDLTIATYILPFVTKNGGNVNYNSNTNETKDREGVIEVPVGNVVFTSATMLTNLIVGSEPTSIPVNTVYRFRINPTPYLADGYYNCEGGNQLLNRAIPSEYSAPTAPAAQVKVATKKK